jgi:hypothetical protein
MRSAVKMMFAFQPKFTEKLRNNADIAGVLAYCNETGNSALTDGYDLVMLVVCNDNSLKECTFHYIEDNCRIQEKRISRGGFEDWIYRGENRNIMQWILQGEIVLDSERYLESFKQMVLEFPEDLRERKLLTEFSLFLKNYLQSKGYMRDNHVLDAYNDILEALHHWARLAIIEQGIHPEVTVWEQVRKINPGVYKLYEELTTSHESLDLRIQLVLLACQFSVASKLEKCCGPIFRVLESGDRLWSVQEIRSHPALRENPVNLSLLLGKLVKKSLVREVAVPVKEDLSMLELRYTL